MNSTEVRPRGTNRTNAAVAGVLFIIGTVSGVLMFPVLGNLLTAPDHLTAIATYEGRMIAATLLKFIMGVACAGIGLALYPILRTYNEGLAIGSVGFRVIEGMVDIVGALALVALLALSQEFVKAGAPGSSYFQTADVLIKTGTDWLTNWAMLVTWCIGALMYYSVFYRSRLVPRWLTVWGLVGITLTLIGAVLVLFHLIPIFGTVQMGLNLPIAVQEMVLAVWLIAKGFNPRAVASAPAIEPSLAAAGAL
jgi:amino acid permease